MPDQALRHAIGVDLGGTKIEIGIVSEKGDVIDHCRLETIAEEGASAIEMKILKTIVDLRNKNSVPISGVGIGVPGQVESYTGTVIFAPNLHWHNIPLKANMSKALGLPITVINDVRAITMGEWFYGAGKDCKDILCVFIGTGIGCGIVSGGRLLTGCSNTCGEVGHMTIDLSGPICTCGKKGCFEAVAGGWGIAETARAIIKADGGGEASKCLLNLAGGTIQNVDAKVVVDAYLDQDPLATRLIHDVQRALIMGLTNLVNLFNPCRLILGGGFIDGLPEIVPILETGIREIALKATIRRLEVVTAKLGKKVGVIGSTAAFFNSAEEQKRMS